jgi:hypothetical protein
MSKHTDQNFLLAEEYDEASDLKTRIRIQERQSTNLHVVSYTHLMLPTPLSVYLLSSLSSFH